MYGHFPLPPKCLGKSSGGKEIKFTLEFLKVREILKRNRCKTAAVGLVSGQDRGQTAVNRRRSAGPGNICDLAGPGRSERRENNGRDLLTPGSAQR